MNTLLADRLMNYDATALAEGIRLREWSATQVMEAHLQRIEKLNGKYNALVTLDKERAIRRAMEADSDLAQGKVWGPLHGVPITIKDALETEGLRTTVGHAKYRDYIPSKDAWVVSKLKSAGAIVIGKTNCAALCADIQTTNEIFGVTNNPWDITRTSGGSSGGDAVAVALGMSALGIGSDTGGSIRIPSSYCGIFGLKTSIGKIPREGLLPLHDKSHPRQDSLSVLGPIARSLRDLTLCYTVLTEESTAQETNLKPPKIYWTQKIDVQVIDDEVSKVIGETFSTLFNDGVDVAEVESPIAFGKIWALYGRLNMFEFMPEENGRLVHNIFWFFESLRSLFRGGAASSYRKLKQDQSAMSGKVEDFMKGCDCWVLPVTPSVAFRHQRIGLPIQLTVNGGLKKYGYFAASGGFAYPFNMLGNPSVVIPVGKNKDGMPIAVQVVGKVGEDIKLLNAAAYLAKKIGHVDFAASVP